VLTRRSIESAKQYRPPTPLLDRRTYPKADNTFRFAETDGHFFASDGEPQYNLDMKSEWSFCKISPGYSALCGEFGRSTDGVGKGTSQSKFWKANKFRTARLEYRVLGHALLTSVYS
jgi:hypothetical protein